MGKTFSTGLLTNGIWQDASNNVGIGAAPSGSYKLEVTGTGRFTGDILVNGITIGASDIRSSSNILTLGGTSEVIRITGGNVGIGTSSPSGQFQVQATNSGIVFDTATAYTPRIKAAGALSDLQIESVGNGGNLILSAPGTTSIMTMSTNSAERMRISAAGYVSIGKTTSQSKALELYQATDAALRIQNSTTGTGNTDGLLLEMGGVNALLYNYESGYIAFGTTATESMRIRADQNVGIGTGGFSDWRLYVKGVGTTSAAGAFIVQNNADTLLLSVRNDGLFGSGTAANSPYNLTVTGRDCYIDSTGYLGYLSSVRESKININNIENVDWLLNLNPVSFNKRKKDEAQNYTDEFYEELDYGLIAEEVELINDQICFYDETEQGRIIKGVSYSKLITPMLKAIQELNERLNKAGL